MAGPDLSTWIGREDVSTGEVSEFSACAMAAMLDQQRRFSPGDRLPALWHWLMPPPALPQVELGPDGHPAKGGFLPPVTLERRMWAGGALTFSSALRVGVPLTRRSVVESVTMKEGRSGPLCFVTVAHSYTQNAQTVLRETQDIVYRDRPKQDAHAMPPPAPSQKAVLSQTFRSDSTWLFRYSALTFNGHRIHYDLDHCRRVEGYPDLVVHGPLIATLLAGLAERVLERPLSRFSFRATSPLFSGTLFEIFASAPDGDGTVSAWALGPEERLAMTAHAA